LNKRHPEPYPTRKNRRKGPWNRAVMAKTLDGANLNGCVRPNHLQSWSYISVVCDDDYLINIADYSIVIGV
jgi:hypothetical protein